MGNEDLLIKNLIDGLGESLFSDLIDFDMELREDTNFDIKALMTRRFLRVHTGFDDVIEKLYGDDAEPCGAFVTNLSIALKDLRDKRIMIADDTFLHGRAVKKIIDELVDCGCKKENIQVKVFLKNTDSKPCDDSLSERLYFKRSGDTNTWRYISGKIVDGFMASGQPYVSYLPYYETDLDSGNAHAISEFIKTKGLQDNATKTQKSFGVSSFIYCSPQNYDFCRFNLIRLYKYEQAGKWVVIPYAYLKPLTYKQISDMYKAISIMDVKIRFDGNAEFLKEPEQMGESKIKSQYAYSLLTYLSSVVWGDSFLTDHDLGVWKRNRSVEETSLGCRIDFPMDKALDFIRVFSDGMNEKYFAVGQNNDITDIIHSIENDNKKGESSMSAAVFLDNYLKLSSVRDEDLANQQQERMQGIEIERIENIVTNKPEMWKKMQEVIDTGRGTVAVDYRMINGIGYLDSLLYAGELNYACNEDNMVCFVYPLLQYEMYCREKGIRQEEEREVKDKIIHEIKQKISGMSNVISVQETEFLLNDSLYNKYREYYWNKYNVFKNDKRIIDSIRIEKEYE